MSRVRISQLKIGAILSYLTIAFNIAAGLLYTPWMIEQIGQSDYGLHTLANSLITLVLVDFGLGAATSRFIAKYRVENDATAAQRFLSAVYKLYFLLDVVILISLLIVYCFVDKIYVNLSSAELEKFKVVFCIAGFYSLVSFPCANFQGVLIAYEQYIPLKVSSLISKIGTVAFTVFALMQGMGLYALVIVNATWGLISIMFQYIYVRKCIKFGFVKNTATEYREIFTFSLWTTVSAIASRLVFNITPTIIGITVTAATSAIAVFGIVTTIEGYFFTITTAINGMFLPRITKIIQDDDDGAKLTSLSVKLGRYQFALNGLMILGFFLIGKEFILMWMGETYIDAYYGILLVILPGLFYNALQVPVTTLVVMNLVNYQAWVQIATGVCNVILSFVFSYYWGVIGSALSICLSYILRTILILIVIRRKTKISLKTFVNNTYLKMSLPILVSLIVCIPLNQYMLVTSWMTFCMKGMLIVAVYAVTLLIIGLTRDERSNIFRMLIKRGR